MELFAYCLIGTSAQADRIIRALRVLDLREVSLLFPGRMPEFPPVVLTWAMPAGVGERCTLDLPGIEGFTVTGPLLTAWRVRKPACWAGIAESLQDIGISATDAVFIVRCIGEGYGLIVAHVDNPGDLERAERILLAAAAADDLGMATGVAAA